MLKISQVGESRTNPTDPYITHTGDFFHLYHFHVIFFFPFRVVQFFFISRFSSVQLLSRVQLFSTPRTAVHQASLSHHQDILKLMSIELVMPSNCLILCRPLLLPPSIFPSIRVFSNESALRIRWPKYWSFSFNISPSNEHLGLISFRVDWLDLLAVLSFLYSATLTSMHDHWKDHSLD